MKNTLTFLLSLMTLALLTTTAFPQTITTGSIAGTVTDPSGAAVPEITLTATSPNLIQPQSATTGRDGHYLILNLPPGKYTISVGADKGFAKFEQDNVDVNLGKTSPGDIQLQLAGVREEHHDMCIHMLAYKSRSTWFGQP